MAMQKRFPSRRRPSRSTFTALYIVDYGKLVAVINYQEVPDFHELHEQLVAFEEGILERIAEHFLESARVQ